MNWSNHDRFVDLIAGSPITQHHRLPLSAVRTVSSSGHYIVSSVSNCFGNEDVVAGSKEDNMVTLRCVACCHYTHSNQQLHWNMLHRATAQALAAYRSSDTVGRVLFTSLTIFDVYLLTLR